MQGKPVSDFSLACTGVTTFQFSAVRGTRVVRYFYPKDNAPGCTAEVASPERFKEKMRFPFELLADPDEAVCGQLGVMKEKPMYGKKARGIPKGSRGVKVPGHAQEVLNFAKAL